MANVSSSNGLEKRPSLRFPGFDEPWVTKQFSDVFSFLSNNTLSRADLISSGDIHNIHYGDVLIKYGSIIDVEYDDIPYIAHGRESKGTPYLRDGDVIIADTAEDETVGKCCEIININDAKVESGLHTIPCRPMLTFAPMFLGYYMNSYYYHKQLFPLMQGVKVLSISKGNIGGTLISLPRSHSEQKKIVDLLRLIDIRIRKQQQIIETLKKYKRGVVHELLSPEKCKLSGVTWTSSKIGDLGNFIKGAPLSKADISPDGTPFILYGELYTTYNEVITSIVRKTNAKVDEIYYSRIGDVIIPTSGETPEEISTASCVMQKGVILAGDLNIFRGNMLDGRILSYILNHIVNAEIARVAQGKSVVHVQASEISKIEISYPDADAQKKMISIFEAIAEKIFYAEKQLKSLNDLRSGLLQQLFI